MTQDDVPRGCEMYLPVSDNPSVIETSVDSEQDVCCDAEEKEKMLHTCKMSSSVRLLNEEEKFPLNVFLSIFLSRS